MNLVFMGTSAFAVPSLQMANKYFTVAAVISQPDRPRGRGHRLEPTPVKQAAQDMALPVYQFNHIKDPIALETIASFQPDIIVVVSYGQIIPPAILDLPRCGCINVHASLLPRYRGAAPVQRAIMAGEETTGVTTMFMDQGLDTGDIIMQTSVAVSAEMTHGILEDILAREGAELLVKTIQAIKVGTARRFPQDNQLATYAAMIHRQDELIDWSARARDIHNQIRALNPKPGAYTTFNDIKLKVFSSKVYDDQGYKPAGVIISATPNGLLVQTGQGCLEILELQREGKKRLPTREFLKGVKLLPGDQLGN